MTRSNLYQRLFAGLWLLACVGLAVAGWRYQARFPTNRSARAPTRCSAWR